VTAVYPKLITLAYYDGATEGFVNGMANDRVYFFKVVAWDRSQDKRLYLAGEVDRSVYLELLDVLGQTHQATASLIWTPSWIFSSRELEARANNLVAIGLRSLSTPAFLALGEDLLGAVDVVQPNQKGLERAMALAKASTPGCLEDWLALAGC
jgi:hypothetical protein